jgi:Dimerisation domain
MEFTRIKNLNLSFISSFALKCAIDLDIAGNIQAYGQPIPLNELARAIPTPPEKEWMLARLMTLFVHQGTFTQSEAGYMLTPMSELILTNGSNMGAYMLSRNLQRLEPYELSTVQGYWYVHRDSESNWWQTALGSPRGKTHIW